MHMKVKQICCVENGGQIWNTFHAPAKRKEQDLSRQRTWQRDIRVDSAYLCEDLCKSSRARSPWQDLWISSCVRISAEGPTQEILCRFPSSGSLWYVFVSGLYTKSLHKVVYTRSLYTIPVYRCGRSLHKISFTRSLHKVSKRDLRAKSLEEISVQGL